MLLMRLISFQICGKATFLTKSASTWLKFRLFSINRCYCSKSMGSLIVAVCQLNCTADRKKNFETCESFINKAYNQHAKMVFFPECFDHVGESKKQSIELAEPLDGTLISKFRKLAAEKSMWLSLGGFHEKDPLKSEERVFNSHIIIDGQGNIASVYRKIHLFEIDIPGGIRLKESDFSIPGNAVVPPIETPVGKVGLGICYDLRFPEFALSLTKAGAEILTFPSAFTQTTGMAHWEPLLRSRAIETQTYVIAAAQTGKHNPKRVSYGHAMVVDPWGCVIACCSEGEGIIFAEIKKDMISKIRTEMPIWQHRREKLYGDILVPNIASASKKEYKFANIQLHPDMVFYETDSSMAFVNRKCILPGHVLLTPHRCAKRLGDLTSSEVADLFNCVQKVQKVMEEVHGTSSSTIAIQDGRGAGQTIEHIHVHIIPRSPGDLKNNDEIYQELYNHDKDDVKWRNDEEMIEEAKLLKTLFTEMKL